MEIWAVLAPGFPWEFGSLGRELVFPWVGKGAESGNGADG